MTATSDTRVAEDTKFLGASPKPYLELISERRGDDRA